MSLKYLIASSVVFTSLISLAVSPSVFAQESESPEASTSQQASFQGGQIHAELPAIVKVFSKHTKRNYIFDERVKGKISIYLPGRMNAEEAQHLLDAVLAFKGFTAVPIGDNLWKIVPAKEARQGTIPTVLDSGGRTITASVITRILSLKYVSAEDMKQLLSQLISTDGLISAYTGTNSLVIIDSEDNIERLIKLVDSLDVPSKDRDMIIIPITHADAVDIAEKLKELLGVEGNKSDGRASIDAIGSRIREGMLNRASLNTAGTNAATGQPQIAPPSGGSASTISATSREPKIIPDERTNSIIVVADEDTIARIRALISQLDSKVDLSGTRFYVYRCQHANAEDLAEVLSGLAGDGGSTGSGSTRGSNRDGGGLFGDSSRGGNDLTRAGGLQSGNNREGSRYGSSLSRSSQDRRSSRSGQSGGTSGGSGVASAQLGENVSITADPATNALIIHASKSDYLKLLQLLEKLDIKRRQVLVEATLLEVGIESSAAMGMDFLASTGGADGGGLVQSNFGTSNLNTLFSNPGQLSGFAAAVASAGTLTLPTGDVIPTQSMLLTAAQSNSNVNILSAPSILTTDNEEAEIVVGQNVPFVASTATTEENLNNTFNQIDRQDVGITLRITPQISSADTVTLNIFTEVSSLVQATLASSLGPTTTIRTSQTTVITKDGQLVVIGGLMADDISDGESGVPFLKDIPVLGTAFRDNTTEHRRRNLLIFITPRVVRDQFDSRDVTVDKRERMEDFISANDLYPRREDVLRNYDIDKVSESSEYTGPKPSTIIGNKLVSKGNPESSWRDELIKESALPNTLELKVAPKIPAEFDDTPREQHTSNLASPASNPKIELGSQIKPVLEKRNSGSSYIVMKMAGAEIPSNLPFTVQSKGSLFGVVIPEESPTAFHQFFRPGEQYQYHLDGKDLAVTTLGIFGSPDEAATLLSQDANSWYTLSPHELMSLGVHPWKKLTG